MLIRRLFQADSLLILLACVWFLILASFVTWFGYDFVRYLRNPNEYGTIYGRSAISQWQIVAAIVAALNTLSLAAIPVMGLWVAGKRALWGRFLAAALVVLAVLVVVNCGS